MVKALWLSIWRVRLELCCVVLDVEKLVLFPQHKYLVILLADETVEEWMPTRYLLVTTMLTAYCSKSKAITNTVIVLRTGSLRTGSLGVHRTPRRPHSVRTLCNIRDSMVGTAAVDHLLNSLGIAVTH